jgi:hypothetical protein
VEVLRPWVTALVQVEAGSSLSLASSSICHRCSPSSLSDILDPRLISAIKCAKKIVTGLGGMKNW